MLLLEREAAFPEKSNLAPEKAAIQRWSMIGRAGL